MLSENELEIEIQDLKVHQHHPRKHSTTKLLKLPE